MTQQYTPAQLEAWAGLSWKLALSDDTTILDKDRRIVAELCCSDNEDSGHLDYNNPDEWPLLERNAALIAAAPDLARLVLERDAEIEELKRVLGLASAAIVSAYMQSDAEWRCHDKIAGKHEKIVREARNAINQSLKENTNA